ncbi:MAG: ThuA domain-containing protein [Planctomycetota bacterium]
MSARALVLIGGWEGHEPRETFETVKPLLTEVGLECDDHESLAPLTNEESLKEYSVIVPCWTMDTLPQGASEALNNAIQHHGVSLAGWHGGMGDAFRSDAQYNFIVGGQFVAHPGDIHDYAVDIVQPDHPITAGLPTSFAVHSEQYYMHVDPSLNVLASTKVTGKGAPWANGVTMPVVWTRTHGKGRVAYSSLGHNAKDFQNEPIRILAARCILWAAGLIGSETNTPLTAGA